MPEYAASRETIAVPNSTTRALRVISDSPRNMIGGPRLQAIARTCRPVSGSGVPDRQADSDPQARARCAAREADLATVPVHDSLDDSEPEPAAFFTRVLSLHPVEAVKHAGALFG